MFLSKFFRTFLAAILIYLSGINGMAQAQTSAFSSLIADSITYDSLAQRLTAKGNVVVLFNDTRLEASEITYDAAIGQVTASGGIRLIDSNGEVFIAEFAQLAADLQSGMISGAKLLLANQFQIAAGEIQRSEGRYNTIYRAVGSSCEVCFERPVPLWQIRASRIIHDSEKQRFYFENAFFDVLGTPIFYLPNLRMVDPSVTRATGFLTPTFISSDIYGFGLKIPFFATMGEHADFTLTPFVTSGGAALLEAEHRRRYAHGALEIDGAFAISEGDGSSGDGFLSVDADFALRNDFNLNADVKVTNDDGFLRRFGFDEADRLVSELGVSRYRNSGFLEIGTIFFQSLRDDEIDAEVPFVLPEISYRRTWEDPILGGRIGLNFDSVGLFRQTGRDVFKVGSSLDWDWDWDTPIGLRGGAFAELHVDTYKVWDDMGFDDGLLFRFTPIIGAELRLPMIRNSGNDVVHVLEPIAQLVYTPEIGFNDDVPNEDSLQVEFDETNLFAINRFPGSDKIETGFRANVGANYRRYDPTGWIMGVNLGQVFRLEASDQFSAGSGLAGFSSDILAAVSFELPGKTRIINRLLMGNEFEVRRAESEILLNFERFDFDASFVYLAPDVTANSPDARSEANIVASYQIADHWQMNLDWRRDLIENQDIEAGFGVIYGNECVEIDVSVSRRFTNSNNLPAETSFDVTIRLAGFGGGLQNKWPTQRCLQAQ